MYTHTPGANHQPGVENNSAGIFFTTYESSKTFYVGIANHLPFPNGVPTIPTPLVHSLASGTAELASCLVLTPAEVIKQNAQMLRCSGKSASNSGGGGGGGWRNSTSTQALRMISQSKGARGAAHRLLTGYGTLAARNLPFTVLQFPIFEAIRRWLWERRDYRGLVEKDGSGGVGGSERKTNGDGNVARGLKETGLVNATSAAMSGAIAAVVTTPTDVVKTRMMLSAGEADQAHRGAGVDNHSKEQPRHGGPGETSVKQGSSSSALSSSPVKQKMSGWQVARLVYQERGLKGLFRGGLLRASWTAVGSGLYLGTYEVAKVWLKGTGSDDGEDDGL